MFKRKHWKRDRKKDISLAFGYFWGMPWVPFEKGFRNWKVPFYCSIFCNRVREKEQLVFFRTWRRFIIQLVLYPTIGICIDPGSPDRPRRRLPRRWAMIFFSNLARNETLDGHGMQIGCVIKPSIYDITFNTCCEIWGRFRYRGRDQSVPLTMPPRKLKSLFSI